MKNKILFIVAAMLVIGLIVGAVFLLKRDDSSPINIFEDSDGFVKLPVDVTGPPQESENTENDHLDFENSSEEG